jgi:hypothetical protein
LSLTAPQDATVADGCIRWSILSRFAVRERRLFVRGHAFFGHSHPAARFSSAA